jgi:hypothetical protein
MLTVESGSAAMFKDRVHSALLHYVRAKFLSDPKGGFAFAERSELDFAWKMLRQVRTRVGSVPGLVAGIIEYGDQHPRRIPKSHEEPLELREVPERPQEANDGQVGTGPLRGEVDETPRYYHPLD